MTDDTRHLWQRGEWKLYVFFTADGRRLYAGITSRTFAERWDEHSVHERNRHWYALVDPAQTHTETLGEMWRWQAELIERQHIRHKGGTLANNQHNRGRGRRFVDQLIANNGQPPTQMYGEVPWQVELAGSVSELVPYLFIFAPILVVAAVAALN